MNAWASATVAALLACVADDLPDVFAAGVFVAVWENAVQAASNITTADLRIRCENIAPPEGDHETA
jgi:hypothetical protein